MTRLLHLSDTHLHAPGATTLHPEVDSRSRLSTVIDRIRGEGPFDAVVITGDVADDGSESGVAQVYELVRSLAPVVIAVPGNHDRSAPVRAVFGQPTAHVGGWALVGLETQVDGEVAGVGDGIAEALAVADERPAVLLMHHPLESSSTHEWFTLGGGEPARAAVAAHTAPLVVLSGHTHEAYAGRCGEAYLFGAPSTYYSIRHDGPTFEFVPREFGASVLTLPDQDGGDGDGARESAPSVQVVMVTDTALTGPLTSGGAPRRGA